MSEQTLKIFKCQQCKYENWSYFIPQLERLAEEHMMQTGHIVVEVE